MYSGREIAGEVLGDQMNDHLGIGFGAEFMPLGAELFLQGEIILDNAVMHQDKSFSFMRMCVQLGDATMGRPAGMPDADRTGGRVVSDHLL
jgi:hypothetical protein